MPVFVKNIGKLNILSPNSAILWFTPLTCAAHAVIMRPVHTIPL